MVGRRRQEWLHPVFYLVKLSLALGKMTPDSRDPPSPVLTSWREFISGRRIVSTVSLLLRRLYYSTVKRLMIMSDIFGK